MADTKTVDDKLASGATWTREEVAKGVESLGNAINALGQKIGTSKKAEPVHVGWRSHRIFPHDHPWSRPDIPVRPGKNGARDGT